MISYLIALKRHRKLFMKLRSFFYPFTVVVSVLLIALGSFFWFTSSAEASLPQENTPKNPSTAIFVSKQTPLMVSLLGERENLEELRQLQDSLVAPLDLNYRQDIQSWVGDEMTMAVTSLDLDRNPENATQPGYLLALTTDNPEKAKAALQVLYSSKAIAGQGDLVFEPYQGVTLLYKRPLPELVNDDTKPNQPPKIITSAVVANRFVLFANHPKVLRDAINNVQAADLNLANSPEYQKILPALVENRIGLSFINVPALAAWISAKSILPRDSFPTSQTLGIAFSLDNQGLLAHTAILGAEASEETIVPLLSKPVDALQYIPGESALAIAGSDLNQLWHSLSTEVGNEDILKSLLDRSIARLESGWEIKLPENIFSWVQGEYALSLLPSSDLVNPDWIFVAEKLDSANAEGAIANLDELAEKQGLSAGILPFRDRNLTVWTKLVPSTVEDGKGSLLNLEAKVQGIHTSIGNYEIFTNSIEAMDEALKGMDNSLLNDETFQDARAPLPFNNNGYFYIDWSNSKAFIDRQLPLMRIVELIAQPLFDDLRTLTVSNYGIDNGVQRSKLFFQFFEGEN
ncbi:DUF3352 domain-containing protein [Limnofasciculus baicalensis]|uniref:DUF3352 domain-containing protein n=1 Tax=Limnofasciculus baicalensis BBK-W-15 TaxID=2699891 RepID=A0AAE3GSW1_9CYAN|nr:DUF3352 domain-containing protein [Limnofasciculus baicalensis]MCP2730061.1 DUF3352 domain-containing protein [Limnofasciculus baicalensis BBK-W-15]